MKAKQVKQYCTPKCMVIQLAEATHLMDTSFPSQHKPGHHGTGPSGAKATEIWDDDEKYSVGED